MFIRPMTTDEFSEIVNMLISEGDNRLTYLTPKHTFVFDGNGKIIGFFTLRINNNIPTLWHFVVKKENRNFNTTMMIIKTLKAFIKNLGFPTFTVAVKKKSLKRFAQYFAKNREQYAETEGVSFYIVEA